MSKCLKCGEEVTGAFCTNCGSPATESKVNLEKTTAVQPETISTESVQLPQNQYQDNSSDTEQANQNPTPPPAYNNTQANMPTSVGTWFCWLLLISFLNIIGIVIMLISVKDESLKNFAKAYLIIFGICAALSIVIVLICILIPLIIGYASSH